MKKKERERVLFSFQVLSTEKHENIRRLQVI